MAAAVKEMVDAKIKGKKVMVFSKSYCPFCQKAKKELEKLIKNGQLSRDDYEVLEMEDLPNCGEIQNYLSKLTGAKSVPRVFINGKCIGGGDETVSMAKSGKLAEMVA